jgi:hypothetical protein
VARSLNERRTLVAGSSAADLITHADLHDVQARLRPYSTTPSMPSRGSPPDAQVLDGLQL